MHADRGYDSHPHRHELRARGIRPLVAKRNTPHGSGLGSRVGSSNAPSPGYTNTAASAPATNAAPTSTNAFLDLACSFICHRQLRSLLCRRS